MVTVGPMVALVPMVTLVPVVTLLLVVALVPVVILVTVVTPCFSIFAAAAAAGPRVAVAVPPGPCHGGGGRKNCSETVYG